MDDRDLMTRKDLDNIKTICSQRGTDLALMQQNINTMGGKVDKIEAKVDKFDEKLDKILAKKADKWVEKVIIWAGAVAGAAIITALMSLILK